MQWSKATSYSLIATKSANLRVWWVGGVLPPMVFVGNVICGVGKIVTYNEGRDWRVSDAVPLQKKYWTIVNPIYNHLWRYLEDPREWCGDEYLDRHRWKEYTSPAERTEPA